MQTKLTTKLSRALLVLLSLFLTPVNSAWANDCPAFYGHLKTKPADPHPYRKFKSELKGEQTIRLHRFAGFDSFSNVFTGTYKASDTGSYALGENIASKSRKNFSRDETYLNELQNFALGKMTETGYLMPADAKMFNNLGTNLNYRQVDFFDITREASTQELNDYPPDLLKTRIIDSYNYGDKKTTSVLVSTFWSVKGQILDKKTRRVIPLQLPWEKEEARRGQSLDRKKIPHVTEWGRAAQDIADEITPLYSGNAALSYIDASVSGVKLDDAYVMFHSFDAVNTRYYLKAHPNSTYPPGDKNVNDMLFLVPLKEMIAKYPPSRFSKHVKHIMALSDGKISETEALDILIDLRLMRWDELDSTGRIRQDGPVIINDVSVGKILSMQVMLMKYKFSKEQLIAMMDYLTTIIPTLHSPNTENKYANAADSLLTGYTYHDNNAVEISNLDPQLARRDRNYVMAMIFNSYMSYVGRLSRLFEHSFNVSPLQAKNEAIQMLLHHGVKFGVTASAPELHAQLDRLQPAKRIFQKNEMGTIDADTVTERPFWGKDQTIYLFTLAQIFQWAQQHGAVFLNGDYELNPGYWRQHYFSSQADIL